jgi:hypothetical protein
MTFIKDDEIDKALDYLRDNAKKAAQARADRVYVSEFRKTLKAQIMKEFDDQPLGAQEREAYASDRYQAHLLALRDAVFEDEQCHFLREAAQAKIDAWQTMSANERAMDKVR